MSPAHARKPRSQSSLLSTSLTNWGSLSSIASLLSYFVVFTEFHLNSRTFYTVMGKDGPCRWGFTLVEQSTGYLWHVIVFRTTNPKIAVHSVPGCTHSPHQWILIPLCQKAVPFYLASMRHLIQKIPPLIFQ